jgi:hypothetical protein
VNSTQTHITLKNNTYIRAAAAANCMHDTDMHAHTYTHMLKNTYKKIHQKQQTNHTQNHITQLSGANVPASVITFLQTFGARLQ